MKAPKLRNVLLAVAALTLLLSACRSSDPSTAGGTSLSVTITGLPDGVPGDVTITNLNTSREVNYTTVLRGLPAGTYRVRASEQRDNPQVRFVPDLVNAIITVPQTNSVELSYVPACDADDFDRREECVSLPWYPQGYISRLNEQMRVRASVQVLNSDGSSYIAQTIGSANTSRVDSARPYFSLALPTELAGLQLDSISNVMRSISFEESVCDRSTVRFSNPSVRGNDLFLDIYESFSGDLIDDDGQPVFGEQRIGEVFLFSDTKQRLTLWIYANGATQVFGREVCPGFGNIVYDGLELRLGWNLVGLTFVPNFGEVDVQLSRIASFDTLATAGANGDVNEGRAFRVMPADYDNWEDPAGPIASVLPGDFPDVVQRPFGFINLPRNEAGNVAAPFNNNAKVRLSVSTTATSEPSTATVPAIFAPISVSDFTKEKQLLSLSTTDMTTFMEETIDGNFIRLRPLVLDPKAPNGQSLCQNPPSASITNPRYNTLNFEILTGASSRYSGYATLMYNSTVATWWYADRAFTVNNVGAAKVTQCEDPTPNTFVDYIYDLDVKQGWNVVFTTITPKDPDEFADATGSVYLTARVTTKLPSFGMNVDAGEIPFLYWRTIIDQTRDATDTNLRASDRGSDEEAIKGAVAPCDPNLPTCALSDLLEAEAEVVLRRVVGGLDISASDLLHVNGHFTVNLPETVDPEVPSGTDGGVDVSPESFSPEAILPAADVFRSSTSPTDVCGVRTVPVLSSSDYLIRTRLDFVGFDSNDDELEMGSASLRGSSEDGRTTYEVEWVYVSADMEISWTSTAGGCEFTPPVSAGDFAFDNRTVTMDIVLSLTDGWNMVLRTIENPLSPSAPQVFTWRSITSIPSNPAVFWHADVSLLERSSLLSELLGAGLFEALTAPLSPHYQPPADVPPRTTRSLVRSFLDGTP